MKEASERSLRGGEGLEGIRQCRISVVSFVRYLLFEDLIINLRDGYKNTFRELFHEDRSKPSKNDEFELGSCSWYHPVWNKFIQIKERIWFSNRSGSWYLIIFVCRFRKKETVIGGVRQLWISHLYICRWEIMEYYREYYRDILCSLYSLCYIMETIVKITFSQFTVCNGHYNGCVRKRRSDVFLRDHASDSSCSCLTL